MREVLTDQGVILLTIPNFGSKSLLATLLRLVDRHVYEGYLPMSAEELAWFLKTANLKRVTTKYIGGLYGVGVVNFSKLERLIGNFGYRIFNRLLLYSQLAAVAFVEKMGYGNLQLRYLSPDILAIASR